VFVFGFGKSQLAHGIPGKWLIESPDYGKVGEFFRGSLALQQCETMLSQLRSSTHSFRYRVEKMMLSFPPGTLTEEETAAALFMSKRTLARKLKTENTGFRHIQKDILSQQAANYLRDSKLTVDAIAALLNYHDSSNFRRAFKGWFNVTPEAFRQSL
jgi:AraC-like DNA-binding protein